MQWRSFAFVAVVCWVLWPSVGTAQANPVDERARFELFTDCAPLDVSVSGLESDAAEIGLAEESVQAAVESRLRFARLYSAESPNWLGVHITVVGVAFSVLLQFHKGRFDQVSGEAGWATTWLDGSVGTHGGDAGFIRSSVAEYMDQFSVEYLRVNDAACD